MAATVERARSEYDAFAPYYDAFTAGSDYEAWTRAACSGWPLATAYAGGTLLDLACGTGKSFAGFLRARLPRDRLRLVERDARRGGAAGRPATTLVQADLRVLPELGRFDLVTCFDDSLNYLPDEADLAAAFAGIELNLDSDGLALFDLNSLLAYRTTFASHALSERDGIVFAWRGSIDARRGAWLRRRGDDRRLRPATGRALRAA